MREGNACHIQTLSAYSQMIFSVFSLFGHDSKRKEIDIVALIQKVAYR